MSMNSDDQLSLLAHDTTQTPVGRRAFRFSMRNTLGATVFLMGLIGLVLALVTGEIYQHQALENQRLALRDLVELSASAQLKELENRSRDLALAIQSESSFRNAWASSPANLRDELVSQLRQYNATVRRIHVQQIAVLNGAGLRRAAAGSRVADCQVALASDPATAHFGLCHAGTRVFGISRVPVKIGARSGWIEVMTDPVPNIARISDRLGLPVRISGVDGQKQFASTSWPAAEAMDNALVAETVIASLSGGTALQVAAMRDIGALRQRLSSDRFLVLTVAIAVTLFAVLLAFSFLNRTALEPLSRLTNHLRHIGRDRNLLSEPVHVGGIAEVQELAEDFNHMARELTRLYGSLEHMAYTDPLTNLPNRARFRDSLDEAARRHAHARTPFALLLMDLDRFKAVNDTLGHQMGDLLLQEVSVRLKSVLRGSDTITRLDNETIQELDSKMVARLGGDEFAAILPRVGSMDDATGIARKLLLVMQEPFVIRDRTLSIGISIGVALYPQHGKDIEALIQRADAAMYYAKHNQTGLAFPETMQQTRLI